MDSRIVELNRANTSIAFGDKLLLKIYRRVEYGAHPEVELLDALQRQGFPSSPPIYSAVSLNGHDGSAVLSSLTGYIVHQGDGRTFTVDALSRFFERAHASRVDPATGDSSSVIGGVFSERIRSLAQGMAAMHRALAAEIGPSFAIEPFSTMQQRSLYQAMRGQAGRVLRLLRRETNRLSEADRTVAARVMESRPGILRTYDALMTQRFAAARTRVHGDLHLGQLLNTGKDFVLIDFEGQAGRPRGERALKRCPLVDLAAMVRSLDYAATTALRNQPEAERVTLTPWAELWVREMSSTLINEYFAASAGTPTLSSNSADREALLKIFLLDRALREVAFEIENGTDFIGIPLAAVAQMLA
jgi:maltose alpha-D-glucosyltransferase/alpha-amylase